MLWLQSRWTFVLIAVLGSAMLGWAYYWSRKRAWIKATTETFTQQLDKTETRSAARSQAIQQQLAVAEEKMKRLRELQAMQAAAEDSGSDYSEDEEEDSEDEDDADSVESTESMASSFVLAIRHAIESTSSNSGDDQDMVVIPSGKDNAERNGVNSNLGAHSADRITIKAF